MVIKKKLTKKQFVKKLPKGKPYPCSNGAAGCKWVKERFDVCSVCKSIWDKTIGITIHDENPHMPSVYKDVVQKFREEYWERFSEDLHSFGVELISKEYISYSFNTDNFWEFKFKVVKK